MFDNLILLCWHCHCHIHQARLSEKDVLNIRKLYKKTSAITQIANLYKVSYGCINGIVRYQNWKGVKLCKMKPA